MSKFVKKLQIDFIRRELEGANDLLVVNVVGMAPDKTEKLRTELRGKNIKLKVVRNSLARVVLRERGYDVSGPIFEQPGALVYGGEGIVETAREIIEIQKSFEKFSIKGGFVDGRAIDTNGVEAVSKLPSRLELISIISGQILSPGATLSGQFVGPARTIAGQLKKIAEPEEDKAEADAA